MPAFITGNMPGGLQTKAKTCCPAFILSRTPDGDPGIISTGVLQVTDADNNPWLTGSLVDNHDSVITTFAANQFGLSRITFLMIRFKNTGLL